MCLIIDINIFGKFLDANDADYTLLHQAFFRADKKNVFLVYGGYLAEEYARSEAIRSVVIELDKAGKAVKFDDDLVNIETTTVEELNICKSNDEHIIGLARTSGARILCSHDKKLGSDFTNKKLIDNPRGNVYKSRKHHPLIKKHCK